MSVIIDFVRWSSVPLQSKSSWPAIIGSTVCPTLRSVSAAPFRFLDVSHNELISLSGCPRCDELDCSCNHIATLEGCPASVHSLNCSYNLLPNLTGVPTNLAYLDCSHNKLQYLTDLPPFTDFTCVGNPLNPRYTSTVLRSGERVRKLNRWFLCNSYGYPTEFDEEKIFGPKCCCGGEEGEGEEGEGEGEEGDEDDGDDQEGDEDQVESSPASSSSRSSSPAPESEKTSAKVCPSPLTQPRSSSSTASIPELIDYESGEENYQENPLYRSKHQFDDAPSPTAAPEAGNGFVIA